MLLVHESGCKSWTWLECQQWKSARKVKSQVWELLEIKLDVTRSYVKRQTAKMTSEFVFFSSNPSLNHIKIEKCHLLFATNTNIFTLLFKELKTGGQSFIFAVWRLTYDHVTWNLISLMWCLAIVQHNGLSMYIVATINNRKHHQMLKIVI